MPLGEKIAMCIYIVQIVAGLFIVGMCAFHDSGPHDGEW
jgi:hypothetical protein